MPSGAIALKRRWAAGPGSTPWLPTWSVPSAMRAVRATIVVPGLFAFTDKVIGNLQMATFAAFGGFATLVLANFGGTRRDKLTAHAGLALAGSVLLVIGAVTILAIGADAVVAARLEDADLDRRDAYALVRRAGGRAGRRARRDRHVQVHRHRAAPRERAFGLVHQQLARGAGAGRCSGGRRPE